MNQGGSEPVVREDRNSLLSKSKNHGGTLCYPSTERTKKGPSRSSFPMFSFNHMGYALLSFNRKDQGDLGTLLSFSKKDRRDLASPCSVSIVWRTLCYPSTERTKVIKALRYPLAERTIAI
ncbi:hypothetical protein V6N13_116589 [Hibiscus sabdariffa]